MDPVLPQRPTHRREARARAGTTTRAIYWKTREGAVAHGVPLTAQSTRLTFDDAVKDVETDYAVNKRRTEGELKRRIELHLTPYFGGRRLSAITTADVRAFTARRLEAKASAGEINRELAIIKRAFRLAVDGDRYHGRLPKIPMLQERNVRKGFFDDEMFTPVRDKLAPALQPIVTFAYITGWRIQSEILPLEWRQVDRKGGEATWNGPVCRAASRCSLPATRPRRYIAGTRSRARPTYARAWIV